MKQINLGLEVWQKVFASPLFQQTTTLLKQLFKRNIVVGDFDAMGITQEEWKHIRGLHEHIPFPFCDLILKTTKEGRRRCDELEKQAFAQMATALKTYICTCHAGLTEVTIPIIIDNKYCGCISLFGGFLLHEPNETEWQQIAERVKETGVDLERLKKAYFEITPISKELLEIMVKLLNAFIEEVVKAAIENEEYKKRIGELEKALYEKYQFANIIGKSKPMQDIFHLLEIVTPSDSSVLIQGETGTGKELVARAIHYNSPRKDKPFVTQNCAALSESLLESELFGHIKGAFTGAINDKRGLFEQANYGTLFLDEIGDMSIGMQAKLLRVIENGEIKLVGDEKVTKVDVRIISATNKDLKILMKQDKFREDLYYRLQGFNINLPALRERKEDIFLLISHFLRIIQQDKGKKLEIDNEALRLLTDYDWPGNVRELNSEIIRAATLAEKIITPNLLSREIKEPIIKPASMEIWKDFKGKGLEEIMYRIEKELIIQTLKESKGSKASASRSLNIPWSTLNSKIKKYDLDKDNI
ncbi:MAG: sigma 54-interacting transcriptional regulator [Planctomycetota bacterium]